MHEFDNSSIGLSTVAAEAVEKPEEAAIQTSKTKEGQISSPKTSPIQNQEMNPMEIV